MHKNKPTIASIAPYSFQLPVTKYNTHALINQACKRSRGRLHKQFLVRTSDLLVRRDTMCDVVMNTHAQSHGRSTCSCLCCNLWKSSGCKLDCSSAIFIRAKFRYGVMVGRNLGNSRKPRRTFPEFQVGNWRMNIRWRAKRVEERVRDRYKSERQLWQVSVIRFNVSYSSAVLQGFKCFRWFTDWFCTC